MTLTTHHLEFTASATTPLELDDQAGGAIRGALVGGLWERFCANRAAPSCAACPLLRVCPVAALIAPMRDDGESGGEQRPRPYTVRPPLGGGRRYAAAERFGFGLTLIGQAAQLFPYVVMAAQAVEQTGLGRRMGANGGRRGGLQIEAIAAVDPLAGTQAPLYTRGRPQVHAPGLPIDAAAVAAYAASLPADRLTLHFRSPLRLTEKRDGQTRLVRRFDPRPFFARLAWRLDELARAYGDEPYPADHRELLAFAEAVRVADDQTRWVDVVSYSSRTRSRTPIGGLIGHVTLEGSLAPLRELLVWGSLIHVGKNAVKGDGYYTILAGSGG
ncbi:CRISPR system precrRNA processing endoribonuclease RAMP protein Cas6 [Kouleothrix sp.]|uniref:CRISPR system precrRNA processing endoribonuclease RAMP protein Cas6 n=1 Tax=Kouleothrix sp. TaxID=2779161 RepID=UPI00391DB2DF